jgi:hypothetical protein
MDDLYESVYRRRRYGRLNILNRDEVNVEQIIINRTMVEIVRRDRTGHGFLE